jgi:hypothetical protein
MRFVPQRILWSALYDIRKWQIRHEESSKNKRVVASDNSHPAVITCFPHQIYSKQAYSRSQ